MFAGVSIVIVVLSIVILLKLTSCCDIFNENSLSLILPVPTNDNGLISSLNVIIRLPFWSNDCDDTVGAVTSVLPTYV